MDWRSVCLLGILLAGATMHPVEVEFDGCREVESDGCREVEDVGEFLVDLFVEGRNGCHQLFP